MNYDSCLVVGLATLNTAQLVALHCKLHVDLELEMVENALVGVHNCSVVDVQNYFFSRCPQLFL